MTVRELIEKLQTFPPDMEVVLPVNYGDEYGPPNPRLSVDGDYVIVGG